MAERRTKRLKRVVFKEMLATDGAVAIFKRREDTVRWLVFVGKPKKNALKTH